MALRDAVRVPLPPDGDCVAVEPRVVVTGGVAVPGSRVWDGRVAVDEPERDPVCDTEAVRLRLCVALAVPREIDMLDVCPLAVIRDVDAVGDALGVAFDPDAVGVAVPRVGDGVGRVHDAEPSERLLDGDRDMEEVGAVTVAVAVGTLAVGPEVLADGVHADPDEVLDTEGVAVGDDETEVDARESDSDAEAVFVCDGDAERDAAESVSDVDAVPVTVVDGDKDRVGPDADAVGDVDPEAEVDGVPLAEAVPRVSDAVPEPEDEPVFRDVLTLADSDRVADGVGWLNECDALAVKSDRDTLPVCVEDAVA
uniref:Uncharacterized protein n=1 Tax=Neobodo designis TaxID=312471 RepID=A0A7S1QEI2_NEODS|mmetsp:Transcript_43472/g.134269  ORF Transcript_43472/g.134269 Transcript_43472/m.134269 type:complete len:310 (+) Transcript_43472:330-1259(+)